MKRCLSLSAESLRYGPSYGVLRFMIRSPEPLDPQRTWHDITRPLPPLVNSIRTNYPPAFARAWLLRHKQRADARDGIAAHYDVSNEFYELFLDRKYMFYTCADHLLGHETLEEARSNKAEFLLKLIDPHPGERILELGSGWGAMLKRIHEHTGDRDNLFGYTLSGEQKAHNDATHRFIVEFRNFITADYPTESFDKIYSIGAGEHVRPHEIPQLLAKLYGALKSGGRLVQHFFCHLIDPLPATAIVSQIFFPGAVNASYRFHVRAFEAAGFRVVHTSIHDYRQTLRDWFDNLVAHREQALKLVDVETYNRYLVFFASAYRYFDEVSGMLLRFVRLKPERMNARTRPHAEASVAKIAS